MAFNLRTLTVVSVYINFNDRFNNLSYTSIMKNYSGSNIFACDLNTHYSISHHVILISGTSTLVATLDRTKSSIDHIIRSRFFATAVLWSITHNLIGLGFYYSIEDY